MPKIEGPVPNLAFLKQVERRLRAAGVRPAAFEAEALIRHFARLSRIELYAGHKAVSAAARRAVLQALRRRVRGVPLHHLLGEADFYGHRFLVSRHTLIPRPETELLVEEAGRLLDGFRPAGGPQKPRILDLGTGSGCIAICLTIRRADCRMTALDVSLRALETARKNARLHGTGRRIRFVRGDLFSPFKSGRHCWDAIVSNPPYVPDDEIPKLSREVRHEPFLALNGGKKGLEILRRILSEAPPFLEKEGLLLMEIGKGQARAVEGLAKKDGRWTFLGIKRDYAGIPRIASFKKRGK